MDSAQYEKLRELLEERRRLRRDATALGKRIRAIAGPSRASADPVEYQGTIQDHEALRRHLETLSSVRDGLVVVDLTLRSLPSAIHHQVELLATIPGLTKAISRVLMATVGPSLAAFPTAGHLMRGAGLSPAINPKAAKMRDAEMDAPRRFLRVQLRRRAKAEIRRSDSHFRDLFVRVCGQRGSESALDRVAGRMIYLAWHVLSQGRAFDHLGDQVTTGTTYFLFDGTPVPDRAWDDFSEYLCAGCGANTSETGEFYMVWHRIWRKIAGQKWKDDILCLDCAEKRLGRALTGADFTAAPVNAEQAAVCPRLAERMAAAPHHARRGRPAAGYQNGISSSGLPKLSTRVPTGAN